MSKLFCSGLTSGESGGSAKHGTARKRKSTSLCLGRRRLTNSVASSTIVDLKCGQSDISNSGRNSLATRCRSAAKRRRSKTRCMLLSTRRKLIASSLSPWLKNWKKNTELSCAKRPFWRISAIRPTSEVSQQSARRLSRWAALLWKTTIEAWKCQITMDRMSTTKWDRWMLVLPLRAKSTKTLILTPTKNNSREEPSRTKCAISEALSMR